MNAAKCIKRGIEVGYECLCSQSAECAGRTAAVKMRHEYRCVGVTRNAPRSAAPWNARPTCGLQVY